MCVFSVENVESDCEALQGGDGSFLRMPFFCVISSVQITLVLMQLSIFR